MEEICGLLEQRFPCRQRLLQQLTAYIGDPKQAFPATLYLYGHSGTGKTAIVKNLLQLCVRRFRTQLYAVYINCVECYTSKLLFNNVLEELVEQGCLPQSASRCEALVDFVATLSQLSQLQAAKPPGLIIALDNAERLRDMETNVLPTLLRLQNYTALNICVLLISQLPYEKYYGKFSQGEMLSLHCAQYSKAELLQILGTDLNYLKRLLLRKLAEQQLPSKELKKQMALVENLSADFFENYLNLFLGVFFKACRDMPELRLTARKCFFTYVQPVLEGSIEMTDVSRLWRNIAVPLRKALTQLYTRCDELVVEETPTNSVRNAAKALELPYYGKYLLIAAFLASHNSSKDDKRLFVKNHGKQKKRLQAVNAKAKVIFRF